MRHNNLANRNNACLVVVDMQKPFLNAMFDKETVTANVNKLIKTADILQIPIIVTLQNKEKMGDTAPEVLSVLPEHQPIDKMTFSCCGSEEFVNRLTASGCKSVILCGIETHICINQTAHDLIGLGYQVHIPEDGVCSRTERNWSSALSRLRHAGAIITSTESVMYELLVEAGTDEFRQILKMVK